MDQNILEKEILYCMQEMTIYNAYMKHICYMIRCIMSLYIHMENLDGKHQSREKIVKKKYREEIFVHIEGHHEMLQENDCFPVFFCITIENCIVKPLILLSPQMNMMMSYIIQSQMLNFSIHINNILLH